MSKEFNKYEYNKLCAEFMGYEYYGWNHPFHKKDVSKRGYWAKKNAKSHDIRLNVLFNPLRFDSDWNWIMEVVGKICTVYKDTPITSVHLLNHPIFTPKEAVVQAIWEFLNWYNEQKS